MISTKCSECMFASPIPDSFSNSCSKNIIDHISSIKKITKDSNKFNIIENYACRYGFSKKIYEENKENLENNNFDQMLSNNSKMRYHLILDMELNNDIDNIIKEISKLDILPSYVSFMFRNKQTRTFIPNKHTELLNSINQDFDWKIHNFLEELDLEHSIDHILSTNFKNNNTYHFLVYSSNNIHVLNSEISSINNNIMLYQKSFIAMLKNSSSLYGLLMSFDNYKVAKSIDYSLLSAINTEPDSITFY